MHTLHFSDSTTNLVDAVQSVLTSLLHAFRPMSLLAFAVTLLIVFAINKLISYVFRRFGSYLRHRADESTHLPSVRRLRRAETIVILMSTVLQLTLFMVGMYVWWRVTHQSTPATGAILGAGAIMAVVVGSFVGPLLRDAASGSAMMVEHWYGVGDLITVEFPKAQGVVEAVTLRSTKIRGLNGEVIWLSNQSVQGVSVVQKGVFPIAIELFVSDVKAAEKLIERVNYLLPTGSALLAQTLQIVNVEKRTEGIWHLTAIGETALGREWILQDTALELLKKTDEDSKKHILLTAPVARYADMDTEKQFVRAVKNARKPHKRTLHAPALSKTQIRRRVVKQKAQ